MKPSPFADLPPILDDVRVASPCTANWEEMAGDDRKRFCSHCRLHVYNLSAMKRDEAEQLVRDQAGRLCIRFYRRSDGTVLTRDCPVGLRALRQRFLRGMAMATATVVSLVTSAYSGWSFWKATTATAVTPNACQSDVLPTTFTTQASVPEERAVLGKMMPPPVVKGDWAMGGCPAPPNRPSSPPIVLTQ